MDPTPSRAPPSPRGTAPSGRRGQRAPRGRAPRGHASTTSTSLEDGPILLTGVQALVRLLLDQHRADRAPRAATPATFVSGYQGSPLGGLDQELARAARARSTEHDVRFTCPASTRSSPRPPSWGTQLAGAAARRRATTACSASGTARRRASTAPPTRSATATSSASSRTGGALAAGRRRPELQVLDAAERVRVAARRACTCRCFFPGDAAGGARPRPARRRAARARPGLWAGFKIVTSVADAAGTVDVGARPRRARSCPSRAGRAALRARAERQPARRRRRSSSSARCSASRTRARARRTRARTALNRDRRRAARRLARHRRRRQGLLRPACSALRDLGLDERELERAGHAAR